MHRITIISGGQSGVDRAALDFALKMGIPCGGWCPRGRWAEDGPLPLKYPLKETPSSFPEQRTEWNVRDSDFTLILHSGELSGGTRYTWECAERYRKPHALLLLPVEEEIYPILARHLQEKGVRILNVAGPRESRAPGIYARTYDFLSKLWHELERL